MTKTIRIAALPFWACVAAASAYYPQTVGVAYLVAFLAVMGTLVILLLWRWRWR